MILFQSKNLRDLKKGYNPSINIVRDGNGDLVADSQRLLAKLRKHFS